ncbi:MAG: hypothetical protein HY744_11530 [Deltaproteobacteria bacterium]|nr:hypothetical protein [Deltaproteobacteria bacterium]
MLDVLTPELLLLLLELLMPVLLLELPLLVLVELPLLEALSPPPPSPPLLDFFVVHATASASPIPNPIHPQVLIFVVPPACCLGRAD